VIATVLHVDHHPARGLVDGTCSISSRENRMRPPATTSADAATFDGGLDQRRRRTFQGPPSGPSRIAGNEDA
jgi:hypothetical protein